jgi:uncharacterized membrane protein
MQDVAGKLASENAKAQSVSKKPMVEETAREIELADRVQTEEDVSQKEKSEMQRSAQSGQYMDMSPITQTKIGKRTASPNQQPNEDYKKFKIRKLKRILVEHNHGNDPVCKQKRLSKKNILALYEKFILALCVVCCM